MDELKRERHMARRTVRVPQDVRTRVYAELDRCIQIAEDIYDREFPQPHVDWTGLSGTTAGTAMGSTNTIQLNSVLLMENLDDMIGDTVGHEFAHIVDYIVNPHTRMGRKRSIHGPTWKTIMRQFGLEPNRCHNYDTTNAKTRRVAKYEWHCACGNSVMSLGSKRHQRQKQKPTYFMRGHKHCGGYTFGKSAAPLPIAANDATPKPKTGTRSKLDICRSVYDSTLPRADNIRKFIGTAGCTPAGAATYYAKIKGENK